MKKKKRFGKKSSAGRTAKAVTIAVGVGAVVGAAAALLSAPKSGRELTKDLRRETKRGVALVKKQAAIVERELAAEFDRLDPEVRAALRSAKRRLAKQAAAIGPKLTQSRYHEMVQDALEVVGRTNQEAAHKISAEWKRAYARLKKRMS